MQIISKCLRCNLSNPGNLHVSKVKLYFLAKFSFQYWISVFSVLHAPFIHFFFIYSGEALVENDWTKQLSNSVFSLMPFSIFLLSWSCLYIRSLFLYFNTLNVVCRNSISLTKSSILQSANFDCLCSVLPITPTQSQFLVQTQGIYCSYKSLTVVT